MKYRHIILSDEDIKNVEKVQLYITKSFSKRKPKKSNKLYINICNIYNFYPNLIENILTNIPKLGYYKDYFHILYFSNNYQLNNYIYNAVIVQITSDITNLQNNGRISTLGKWLPSEGSRINRKINFIDKFAALFWGKANKFTLRKQYRKLKTQINQKLGTLESLMNTKQYEKINLEKASYNALSRHKHHLVTHEELVPKFYEFDIKKLKKMNLFDFTKELFENKYDIKSLETVWNQQNYNIPYLSTSIDNAICVVDLSKDMFINNSHYLSIGISLLVDKFSKHKNSIIVGSSKIVFEDTNTIIDKKNKLLKYSGPCKDIKASDYKKIINNNEDYVLVFVTNKHIEIDVSNKVLQIVPYHNNNYDIIMNVDGKYKKVTKYDDQETTEERIKSIINCSPELRNMNHLYFIMGVSLFWLMIKYYGSMLRLC